MDKKTPLSEPKSYEEYEAIFNGPESFEFSGPDGKTTRAVPIGTLFPGVFEKLEKVLAEKFPVDK